MKIKNVIKNKEKWLNSRYEVFSYDRQEMIEKTRKDPEWIHFGCGNLFRAFEAVYCDKLLDEGALEKESSLSVAKIQMSSIPTIGPLTTCISRSR